jgi:hypothetical protein
MGRGDRLDLSANTRGNQSHQETENVENNRNLIHSGMEDRRLLDRNIRQKETAVMAFQKRRDTHTIYHSGHI